MYKAEEYAKLRAYCFPFAGGTGSIFREFPSRFGGLCEFIPLDYPGHGENKSPLSHSSSSIAQQLIDELFPARGPYILFAISMGSLVAYEVCKMIEEQGLPPPLALIVTSEAPPQSFPSAMHEEGFRAGQPDSVYASVLQSHRWFEELPSDFSSARHTTYKDIYAMIQADQALSSIINGIIMQSLHPSWPSPR